MEYWYIKIKHYGDLPYLVQVNLDNHMTLLTFIPNVFINALLCIVIHVPSWVCLFAHSHGILFSRRMLVWPFYSLHITGYPVLRPLWLPIFGTFLFIHAQIYSLLNSLWSVLPYYCITGLVDLWSLDHWMLDAEYLWFLLLVITVRFFYLYLWVFTVTMWLQFIILSANKNIITYYRLTIFDKSEIFDMKPIILVGRIGVTKF